MLLSATPRHWHASPSQDQSSRARGARDVHTVLGASASSTSRCRLACESVTLPSFVVCLAACKRLQTRRRSCGRTRRCAQPVDTFAPPNAGKSAEAIEAARVREQMVEAALEMATPVPQDFDQAVAYALNGLLKATKEKKVKQSYYFNTGDAGDGGGELGNVLLFAERLAKLLAIADGMEERIVRVVFTDMGASAMAQSRWEPLPDNLVLDYMPPMTRSGINPASRARLMQLLDSAFIIAVAPSQAEFPAFLALWELMESSETIIPTALVNARFKPTRVGLGGELMEKWRDLERNLCPVFHLEQIDTPEDDEDLNPCVIARVFPLPFSVWEDNPDDPDSVDGYFLIDMSPDRVRSKADIYKLLKMSRTYFRSEADEL
mmetsp:Transcript_72702/g.135847  ORF Transcript_72702/g.135847 Transcript_72702/m.135847 type:complete len:377 (+) Transcript_72702:2-1132(+)